jgi:hypothetical protein
MITRMRVLIRAVATLLILLMLLFSSVSLGQQMNGVAEEQVYSGIESVSLRYGVGDSILVIVYYNPKSYYVYKNVHVVKYALSPELDKVVQLCEQSKGNVSRAKLDEVLLAIKAKGLSIRSAGVRGRCIYLYMDLGSVGMRQEDLANELFMLARRFNTTIVVVDTALNELIKLYEVYGIMRIIGSGLVNNESDSAAMALKRELNVVYQELVTALQLKKCLSGSGFWGVIYSPITGYSWPEFIMISLSKPLYECSDIIMNYTNVVANVVRKYIPEEVPIYIFVEEGVIDAVLPLPAKVSVIPSTKIPEALIEKHRISPSTTTATTTVISTPMNSLAKELSYSEMLKEGIIAITLFAVTSIALALIFKIRKQRRTG